MRAIVCATVACLSVGLWAAWGAAPAAALASAPGPSTANSNIVAVYDGGSITAGEVAQRLAEPAFVADAQQNAPADLTLGDEEKVARHQAALRLLLQVAGQRGLDKGPGWNLESRLVEQGVLADALLEETRHQVFVSEQEVADAYATNRFVLLGFDVVEAGRIGISTAKHGERARARAQEALARLRAGQEFTNVAKEYSDLDPALARTASYPANFWGKENGFTLGVLGEGKFSEPLSVPEGFEILKAERLHLRNSPGPAEAKGRLYQILIDQAASRRAAELTKAADGAFPFLLAPADATNASVSADSPLLQSGQFLLTRADVRGFAAQRGAVNLEEGKVLEIIRQESGYQIQMGELARGMGLAQRPEVQKTIRYAIERQLADKARQALLPELSATLPFDEQRIRAVYETNFHATFEAQLKYDCLVVPLGLGPNARPEERAVAGSNAQAKAQALIRRIQEGASFDALTGEPGVQFLPKQGRTVPEGSALLPLVAKLKAGEVAAQPYEDFGGYCVLRVTQYEPRHKMPYEVARNYIVADLRNAAVMDLQRHFEVFLLRRHQFVFGPPGR